MFELPTQKIPAEKQDPKNLIIFSKPKYHIFNQLSKNI
jgi:hypothetical protein